MIWTLHVSTSQPDTKMLRFRDPPFRAEGQGIGFLTGKQNISSVISILAVLCSN
jgi:hypothetical protein